MINNNVTVESQLATSAATFLKWEEVYIFCFLQSETLELGDPCIRTLPISLPPLRVCLVALVRGFCFPLRSDLSRGIHLPLFIPLHSSLFPHSISSFCSVYLSLPCSHSLPNSKAFLKCRASLSSEPISPSKPLLEALLHSPALSLISGYLQCECVSGWLCLRRCTCKKKKKEIRALSHVLLVKSCFSMPRKWGVWRTMTPAWLNEN